MSALSGRTSSSWSPAAGLGVAALFLLAFAVGGIRVGALGPEFLLPGLVDGLAALLIVYVLVNTSVVSWPRDAWGLIVLVYATVATAQLVGLLLPPPGLLEWIVLAALLIFAWNARYGVHRSRIVLSMGLVALALAAFNYSVLPFIWDRTQLPQTPLLDLRAMGESVKGMFVAYTPTRPVSQAFALAGIAAWAAAVWLQWPPEPEGDWFQRLSRKDRDRLLYWLLVERSSDQTAQLGREIRAYLGQPGEGEAGG